MFEHDVLLRYFPTPFVVGGESLAADPKLRNAVAEYSRMVREKLETIGTPRKSRALQEASRPEG